jgi:hypothetical protein
MPAAAAADAAGGLAGAGLARVAGGLQCQVPASAAGHTTVALLGEASAAELSFYVAPQLLRVRRAAAAVERAAHLAKSCLSRFLVVAAGRLPTKTVRAALSASDSAGWAGDSRAFLAAR